MKYLLNLKKAAPSLTLQVDLSKKEVPKDYCSVEYDLKNLVWLSNLRFGK